jgi:FkbM family methyltransferase
MLINYDSFQSMWIMYNWIVDWEEFNLIRDLVKEKDYCLDIGANMGYYTIWFSKYTKKILSFEPNKKNFQRLNQNLRINGLDKFIIPYNIALGAEECLVSFTNDRDGENHICLSENENTEKVECRKLENVLMENNIRHVKYIKIDVEGFEIFVLKGLTDYLKQKNVEIIQIEINKTMSNSGTTVSELVDYLEGFGYNLCSYDVVGKKLKKETYNDCRENYFLTYDVESVNDSLTR